MAVVILDCEGVDGTGEHQNLIDAYITLYSLQLSTLHIVNFQKDIKASNLDQIAVSSHKNILVSKKAES